MINTVNSLPPVIWIILAVALYFFAYLLRHYWIIITSIVVIVIASSLLLLPAGKSLTEQTLAQEGIPARSQCLLRGIFQLAPWQKKMVCVDKEGRQIDLEKLNQALRCRTNQPCWQARERDNLAPLQ